MDSRQDTQFDSLLSILRRRWLVIVACLVVFPVAALIFASQQQKLYEATSTVLLNQQSLANSLTDTPDPSLRVDRDRLMKTQIEIASLPLVADRTLRALKINDLSQIELSENVDVTSEAKTDLMIIRVTDPSAERAEKIATMYAAQYTVYRAQLDTAAITRTLREVNQRLEDKGGSKKLRDDLKDKQAELRTLQTLQTKNAVLVRPADDAEKVQPAPFRDAALSAILGLMVGCGLALLIDARDSRIRDAADLADAWDAPLLGRIPAAPRRNGQVSVAMIDDPNGEVADTYRRVLSKIEFSSDEKPTQTIIAVSATDDEGRSEIVANLAVGIARAGRNVIALDLDFLQPRLSLLFGATGQVGVSDVAVGRVTYDQAAVGIPLSAAYEPSSNGNGSNGASSNGNGAARWDANLGMGSLVLLPSGSVPSNPRDFVGSPDLRLLFDGLRDRFDVVLIDAPGLLRASDAERLCQHADAAIAIASADRLSRDVVLECSRTVAQTPTTVIGIVSTDDAAAEELMAHPRTQSPWQLVGPSGQKSKLEH